MTLASLGEQATGRKRRSYQLVREHPVEAGGTRVPAHNPYWDTYGVTIVDPMAIASSSANGPGSRSEEGARAPHAGGNRSLRNRWMRRRCSTSSVPGRRSILTTDRLPKATTPSTRSVPHGRSAPRKQ